MGTANHLSPVGPQPLRHVSTYGSEVLHLPHRFVEIASGADIAARMMRSETMVRPVAMHRVVAEAMTIRETSFFRDHQPWEMLAERVLPELICKRQQERRLRILSAGCATGQEAYSLAMMLCDRFPSLSEWDVQIVGTDISHSACSYARRGQYSRLEINRGLPARMMLRYFVRNGDEWRIRPETKKLVHIEQGDLRQSLASRAHGYDLVLLRNVLPYFGPQERSTVLAETFTRMQPDAIMMLGVAEQIEDAPELFAMEMAKEQPIYRLATAA